MWFQTTLLLAAVCLSLGAIIPHSTEDTERIVGGQNTTIYQFPWQISMQNITTGRHICGGTIINPTTILTAGHCIRPAAEVRIRAGSTYHNNGGYLRPVSRVVRHENHGQIIGFDIGLLILTYPLVYTPSVQPANLPEFEYDLENNVTVEVSGWGALRFGNRTRPSRLQFVQVQIVDQDECREAYRNMNGTSAEITDNMFCAGAPGGGKDSCQGDSGGPVVERTSGRPTIVHGIVSWGYQCALPSHPGVYTRVSRFLNWIEDNQ